MTNMTKKLLAPWRDIVPIAKVLLAVISISLLGTYFLVSNSGERLGERIQNVRADVATVQATVTTLATQVGYIHGRLDIPPDGQD